MELIVSLVLELLLEILLSLLLEIPFELGISAYRKAWQRNNRSPVAASLGYMVLGFVLGIVSVLLYPESVLPAAGFRGLSLVLAPVLAGGVMHLWGGYRQSEGHPATNLATFFGGAAFAFGLAVARFHFSGC